MNAKNYLVLFFLLFSLGSADAGIRFRGNMNLGPFSITMWNQTRATYPRSMPLARTCGEIPVCGGNSTRNTAYNPGQRQGQGRTTEQYEEGTSGGYRQDKNGDIIIQ